MKIIEVDPKKKEALYLQLYSEIKRLIQSGDLKPKSKLPSKKQLMQAYQISQSTVQNALALLMEEGYLYSEERRGYFVSEIENLFLPKEKKREEKIKKRKEVLRYDFSYSGVDPSSLPKSIFKKLSREVYEEDSSELAFSGDIQGYLPLRESIASYLHESRGFAVSAEQIIISSGTEYLFHIIFKLLSRQHYALEDPGYPMLPQILANNNLPFSPISLDEQGMRIQKLRASKANIACITPSHQFPMGVVMPISRRQELLSWAKERKDRYIIEDDYDSEFKYKGRPLPALKAIDQEDKVIYIGSFSKSISPSLRISYMVLPQRLLEVYQQRLPYFICSVAGSQQKILHRFLEEGYFQKHLNRMRTKYKKKREFLVSCIKDLSQEILGYEAQVFGADAGLQLILSFPQSLREKDFLEACRQRSIRIYPLHSYDLERKKKDAAFLLGYASLDYKDIREGLRELFQAAKESST